ncbi:hypothetical protein A4G19_07095 [Pasteurellaceae bacterium Macca]|nr:hypothetical protein [Pasteurellaceae bacterium Macca]
MNVNQKHILNFIESYFLEETRQGNIKIINNELIETKINEYKEIFKNSIPITHKEAQEIIFILKEKYKSTKCFSHIIKDDTHYPWYFSSKKDISHNFWERYAKYLLKENGFNPHIINSLDYDTDKMMDLLGNPKNSSPFSRRGLVIGDVQSGKTSNYTALINKAADAGYKVIILLTGVIEKLRSQTQERLDKGFIGLDSNAMISNRSTIHIGVGKIDDSFSGISVTTTHKDFTKNIANQLNIQLSNLSSPIIFVLKKNKSVLEKLESWLRSYNAISGKIDAPMLLIDDESDNASVNTKDDEVTTINKGIRKLLKLFTRSSYVAFTATPYANIFINPDSYDNMLEDDLFPRDFICVLESPSNYIGARRIFDENSDYHFIIKNIDDFEDYLPEKHKKDNVVPDFLPNSLEEAIVSFFIINAIRDLRGDLTTHRTMLVNVSRFINVQNKLSSIIDEYVRKYQTVIKNYSLVPNALNKEEILFIYKIYEKHFQPLNKNKLNSNKKYFSWEEILLTLYNSIAGIQVNSVNGGNSQKILDYDIHKETGLRIIAIGGLSLSRGLTLEGLCVSYFYRNSKMYDTLMQMGRWFGYRPNYEDLCQVWMTKRSLEWYSYISEASDELRKDVRIMEGSGLTPKDFGLQVRSDKNALLITALNKMQHTENVDINISIDGKIFETPFLHKKRNEHEKNYDIIKLFIETLNKNGYSFISESKRKEYAIQQPQILNVPKKYVTKFLEEYNICNDNPHLDEKGKTNIIEIINKYHDERANFWDVVISTGNGMEIDFCGVQIKKVMRQFSVKHSSLQLSNSRLGSPSLGLGGLTKKQKIEIEEKLDSKKENKIYSQRDYFISGYNRNPQLIIYPIQLKVNENEVDNNKDNLIDEFKDTPLIGISISIPSINGKLAEVRSYVVNLIKWRELNGISNVDEETEELF